MNESVEFKVGKFQMEVGLTEGGQSLRIRSRDGILLVKPVMANVLEVSTNHGWDTPTKVKIVASVISRFRRNSRRSSASTEKLAEEVIAILEGRDD